MTSSANGDSAKEAPLDPPPALRPAPVRQPNRGAHERLIEDISAKISGAEDRRRFLQDRHRLLRDQQGECRAKRERITEDRNMVDGQLANINKEVS